MASDNLSAQEPPHQRAWPTPGQLQTNNPSFRTQRFSWQETPSEIQRPAFEQSSSPTNSTIEESPVSPREGYQSFPQLSQGQANSNHITQIPHTERTGSPYNFPSPTGTHPAYFAPIVEVTRPQQSEPSQPCSDLKSVSGGVKSPPLDSTPNPIAQELDKSAVIIRPDDDKSTLVYNPTSLAGPNTAIDNHRPGQVAHPNAAVDPKWKHGLCEVDTLCCVGLCCPCIVYGKTQYRISRKTQKEDPTNLLGYESCNGSCGLMALACGFQCE